MPLTVITVKNVPLSLRGDLTRWMQEIATGVYVGNFNSRIREYLWQRVINTVGQGEASMSFACRNEIGYSFNTYNTSRQIIDYDGIPLVLIPSLTQLENNEIQPGFSNASKFHRGQRKVLPSTNQKEKKEDEIENLAPKQKSIVFLDLETTGLDPLNDQIIEIGAIKIGQDQAVEFHRIVQTDHPVPRAITELTGISQEMVRAGNPLLDSMHALREFIEDATLIGYNILFDIRFINAAFSKLKIDRIQNTVVELISICKKKNSFQENYKFETTLKEYKIANIVPHRALEDARLMHQLYMKLCQERTD